MVDFDSLNVAINGAFGESIQYQPAAGGAPFVVQGVFVDSYRRAFEKGEGGVGWATTAPSVGVREADFPSPPVKNDLVTRLSTGKQYLVFDKHADGLGWLNLILKATA
ncbi:head-tail joining protein [Burkholderia multivorans]|uniref:head-tail joining protein n=1 Tax=Burkholderia multivorans TaxID=87883 RepID=UPI000666C7D2|nr:hypothetical protein [Burkholderia multivorans]MDN7965478.1 hypothetical protein [Burkholderia multivorans]